jgi:hypothetical protein
VAISPKGTVLGGVVYFGDMKYYGSGGKALTQVCIQRARERIQGQVVQHTTKAMQLAWGMYERMGFKRSPDLDFKQ